MVGDPDFQTAMSHGGLATSLLAALVSTLLSGPGSRLLALSLESGDPVQVGGTAIAEVTVAHLENATCTVILECCGSNTDGRRVCDGWIKVTAPDIEAVNILVRTLDYLAALSLLAPRHQPHNLAAIRSLSKQFPNVPQIDCFDTSFHDSLDENDRIFALPKNLKDQGIIRYGFQGLPMSQRCGALDLGIVLYLIEEKGHSSAEVRDMLYHASGLLGISGAVVRCRTCCRVKAPMPAGLSISSSSGVSVKSGL